MDEHTNHYVHTDIGVHDKFMRYDSFFAVSAAILHLCARELEDSLAWYEHACRRGIVFC